MGTLKLIYFDACPNAERVRRLLKEVGRPFVEIRQDALPSNHPMKKYASPTVLEDTCLIFGATSGEGGGCSIDIPSAQELKSRLGLQTESINAPKKRKSSVLATIGSIGSAVTVGLCPVCIPAIGAFLSAIGLGFLVQETVLQPLLIGLLGITLFGLFWSYLKAHKKVTPFILGVVMAAGLYVGRYVYLGSTINSVLMYGSIIGIIGVSFWNIKLKKKMACPSCVE